MLDFVYLDTCRYFSDADTFMVYRVKLYQSEDLQEDQRSECREYSSEFTYKDCVLGAIENVISLSIILLGMKSIIHYYTKHKSVGRSTSLDWDACPHGSLGTTARCARGHCQMRRCNF